ncbi:MAG: FecR family protein [Bacteroidales bacterium]
MQKEKNSNTDYLLSRILSGKADSNEVERFALWIKETQNERYFEEYKEVWHTLTSVNPEGEVSDRSLKSLLNYIEHSRRKQRLRKRVLYAVSAAASLILLAGLYTLIYMPDSQGDYSKLAFSKLKYNDDSIKVELSDGSVINPLGKQTGASLTDKISLADDRLSENVRELSYLNRDNSKSAKSDTLKYNAVTIPPGERFVIVLSDGTKVYLHSGSYLRYPVSFGSMSRNVTLEGRAYFDVSKSKVPFIVSTEDMKVEVLGTTFDVEAKRSAAKSSVILIEGSVKVHTDGSSRIISPDEMFSFNREDREASVRSVDSRAMTQWKDGILVLRDISFNDMLESLSVWYGVDIINKTSVSVNERFNGKFDRENIEAAVKTVALSAKVRYRIEKGKLIIVDYK